MRRSGRQSAFVTPETTAKIVSMYVNEHVPVYSYSEKTGMTLYSVQGASRQDGIKIRRGRAAQ